MGSGSIDTQTHDVIIVGTGFSGTYLLHRLLNLNFSVIALEAASTLGGVWCHNTYPGARVDIEVPAYTFAIDKLLNTPESPDGWVWTERFPGHEELRRYFHFVDQRLGGLSRHCVFDTWVGSATWGEEQRLWEVHARDGRNWKARYLLPCVGYAAKPYIPAWEGTDTFAGLMTHTGKWPKGGIDLQGKRVGVVGTGASGVQVVQTIAKDVKELIVFQQTPATAIPMRQRPLPRPTQTKSLSEWHDFYNNRHNLWDGASSPMMMRAAKSDSAADRKREFSRLWSLGGFSFWASNYMDMFGDAESNALVYAFWRDRVRERVKDPRTAEVLAPTDQLFAFGTKRVPLEQSYYESFNLPNVSLVDIRSDPITAISPGGPVLASGRTFPPLDVLILATGFDTSTGSLTQLAMHGRDGVSLSDKWSAASRTLTHLGLSSSGFPNVFFPYGPQAPTFTCNGPVCAEIQGDFIVDLLVDMREKRFTRAEAKTEAEEEWSERVGGLLKGTLFEGTKSYYWGDNVPGKRKELLAWFGGVPPYKAELEGCKQGNWKGFDLA